MKPNVKKKIAAEKKGKEVASTLGALIRARVDGRNRFAV